MPFARANLFLCLLLSAAGALAEQSQRVSPGDQLQLALPQTGLPQLIVALGEFDISDFAQLSADGILLEIPPGLTAGDYTLALYGSDGDQLELLAEYPLQLGGDEATADTFAIQTQLNSSYAFANETHAYSTIAERDHFGSGQFAPQFALTGGDWQFSGYGAFNYDSVAENNLGQREWDLPDYRLAAERSGDGGDWLWQAGHQSALGDSLIASDFNRRGISGQYQTAGGSVGGSLFALRSDPLSSTRQLLLPSARSARTQGGNLFWHPWQSAADKLRLSLGYITGTGTLGGVGNQTIDQSNLFGGDAWSLSAQSNWLDDSLQLSADFAESHFDQDGLGQGQREQRDTAWKLGLTLAPSKWLRLAWLDSWQLSGTRQLVGADFYSIGNLYLAGNIASTNVQLSAQKNDSSVALGALTSANNVDNAEYLPSQTQRHQFINFSQTLSSDTPAFWKPNNLSLNYSVDTRRQPTVDAPLTGFNLDDRTTTASFSLSGGEQPWFWTLQSTRVDFADDAAPYIEYGWILAEPRASSRNQLSAIQLSFSPDAYLQLQPMLQYNEFEDADSSENSSLNWGMNFNTHLLPDKLRLSGQYSWMRARQSFGNLLTPISSENIQRTATLDLRWFAVEAQGNTPAIDIYLQGNYGAQPYDALGTLSEWQAYLGVQMAWGEAQ